MNEVKRRFWQWYHDRGLSVIDGYFDPKVIDRCLDQFDGYRLVKIEPDKQAFSEFDPYASVVVPAMLLAKIERRLDALEGKQTKNERLDK